MHFKRFIGIDYSGAASPLTPSRKIAIFTRTDGNQNDAEVRGPWSRRAVFDYIISLLGGEPALIGLDHGFSWPAEALSHRNQKSWPAFLDHVEDQYGALRTVPIKELVNVGADAFFADYAGHLRLTEKRTITAAPVLRFRPRSVAWSTLAGLPWLCSLRREHRTQIHFWPFDGWEPEEGKHCVVEIYPTLFRRLYSQFTAQMNDDARDAFCAAQWMWDMNHNELLVRYFDPPRTTTESEVASREGWILGVM